MNEFFCQKFRFVFLAFAFASAVLRAQTASPLPLAPNNSWTLASPYASSNVQLTVKQYNILGPEVRVYVQYDSPWSSYQLVLTPQASGILLRGFVLNGITSLFADPAPWFRTDVPAGTSWSTILGSASLVSKTDTVRTATGMFSGVWHYRLMGQDWYLEPGVGIVQFGTGAGAFVLTTRKLNTTLEPKTQAVAGPCPLLGIDANAGVYSGLSDTQAVLQAASKQLNFARFGLTWAELEPSARSYDFSKLQQWVAAMSGHRFSLAFTLRTVDTSVFSGPSDLRGLRMDDPQVISRFNALLKALDASVGSSLRWIELGNEIQSYLGSDVDKWTQFTTFYSAGVQTLHAISPSLSVGVVLDYSYTQPPASLLAPVLYASEHVGFTYYPWDGNFVLRKPSVAAVDLADMVRIAGGKPIVITETGYPSSSVVGSSVELQNQFYENLTNGLKAYSGAIAAVNFFQLSDLPEDLVSSMAGYYGFTNPGQAYAFQQTVSTLGVEDTFGNAKSAWSTLAQQAPLFLAANSCTAP